jgi:hypothetical protein
MMASTVVVQFPLHLPMEVTDINTPETEYQPSDSQLERSRALRNFNRLFVFAPVGLFGILFLVSVGFLIYLALFAQDDGTGVTTSAYADALTILATCPLLLLCVIFPSLFMFMSVKARRQSVSPVRSLSQTMWRLENALGSIHSQIDRLVRAIAKPFVIIQAFYAFIQALLRNLGSLIK